MKNSDKKKAYLIEIDGIVQGVGFRPFIYRLARELGINGIVANTTEGVLIKTGELSHNKLAAFIDSVKKENPPSSVIENIKFKAVAPENYNSFTIEKSRNTGNRFQLISPDLATCEKCRQDILNPSDTRRYHYAFTNCTNCGPRFTIIRKMPYDRPGTTMDRFKMCPDCLKEYSDPYDRRFHAQPNACNKCGPEIMLTDRSGKTIDTDEPIKTAASFLKRGNLVGLKSLGGFQIACDALSDDTVTELRHRKGRPSKPFAVMTADLDWINKNYHLSRAEIYSLKSPKAPIVLLRKKEKDYPLSSLVSLYNKYDGIMLPYTPIHHILFEFINMPLVMTSGNISEEPIASENDDARVRLKNICDYYLIHNRDIYSRYDDSVIRIFRDKEMVLRRARGYAPYPVKTNFGTGRRNILAVGAQEKNTFTIFTRDYAITSQHIGDLDTVQSLEFFDSSLKNYKELFGIDDFDLIAYDMHPDYRSTRTAVQLTDDDEKLYPVQHHKAHIAGVMAEHGLTSGILGFSWDGTGYGEDGKIWGSEIFEIDSSSGFNRVGHLTEKVLPGGDASVTRPYRMTAVYLHQLYNKSGSDRSELNKYIYDNLTYKDIKDHEIDVLCNQIRTGFNSPLTTSMGRFFDAVSSLLGCTHISTYEGEAAIALEMAIDNKYTDDFGKEDSKITPEETHRYDFIISKADGISIIEDIYIFEQILDDLKRGTDPGCISYKFHNTLAQIILEISLDRGRSAGIDKVALSGGVFQNNYLLNLCYTVLKNNGFHVYTNFKVPVNDGGISLGQAYLAAFAKNFIKEGENNNVSCNTR